MIKPVNSNNHYPRKLSLIKKKDINFDKSKNIKFKINICKPYKNNIIKEYLFDGKNISFQVDNYTGLYVKRNNRILTKPFATNYIRQTSIGTHFRAVLEYNGNNYDDLFPLQVNKSQFNRKHIRFKTKSRKKSRKKRGRVRRRIRRRIRFRRTKSNKKKKRFYTKNKRNSNN